jgi:YspA, cpYpsA-related SLOG family
MATDIHENFEPELEASPTGHLLDELSLYGYRPFSDEADSRPLPEERMVAGAIADIFDALIATMLDTRLEPDLEDLCWSVTNVFHRAGNRIQRELDDNEDAQKRSQQEQDGSEVRSVELERHLREGLGLIERRNSMEYMREAAGDQFERHFRKSWAPYNGSLVNHRTLTATMVDSRDFINAKRKAEIEPLLPTGTRVAFTAGPNYSDHIRIWAVLDKVLAKYPDMVLFHGGNPTGGEHIAVLWAGARKITHYPFRPNWNRFKKAAPFKRNDQMLEALPKAVIACPGNGINANLVDKARKMGIKVWPIEMGG